METNDPRPDDRRRYEKVLDEWATVGFTGPGTSGRRAVSSAVTWDTGEGCYRMAFQLGAEIHDFTEREFEAFLLGVLAGSANGRR
jgi:hypothetical protein